MRAVVVGVGVGVDVGVGAVMVLSAFKCWLFIQRKCGVSPHYRNGRVPSKLVFQHWELRARARMVVVHSKLTCVYVGEAGEKKEKKKREQKKRIYMYMVCFALLLASHLKANGEYECLQAHN